jgi:hypothetical protein
MTQEAVPTSGDLQSNLYDGVLEITVPLDHDCATVKILTNTL